MIAASVVMICLDLTGGVGRVRPGGVCVADVADDSVSVVCTVGRHPSSLQVGVVLIGGMRTGAVTFLRSGERIVLVSCARGGSDHVRLGRLVVTLSSLGGRVVPCLNVDRLLDLLPSLGVTCPYVVLNLRRRSRLVAFARVGLAGLNVWATVVNSTWVALLVVVLFVPPAGNKTVVALSPFWMIIVGVLVVAYIVLVVLLVLKVVVLTNDDEIKGEIVVVIVACSKSNVDVARADVRLGVDLTGARGRVRAGGVRFCVVFIRTLPVGCTVVGRQLSSPQTVVVLTGSVRTGGDALISPVVRMPTVFCERGGGDNGILSRGAVAKESFRGGRVSRACKVGRSRGGVLCVEVIC